VSWNTIDDLHIAPETFVDFDSSIFFGDYETESTSTIHTASKKINKTSPMTEAKHTSYKKSKRARNPWTPKEDVKMMELMKKYGQSWAMISSQLEGRTGKQVRDRYLNKLRPNIKCGDWSPEEDERLVKLLKEVGNRWSLIATHLPGRTEGQVKNRFYSYIKKRLQPDGTLSQICDSRATSEEFTSFTASPKIEEAGFDFGNEFDINMLTGCTMTFATQPTNYTVTKGAYVTEEETYSEQSTTQGPSSQIGSNSPFRADPTDVISYDVPETLFYRQPSQYRPFNFAPIEHDSQVDDMLSKVTNYFVENTNRTSVSSEIDSFFSEEKSSDDDESSDRLSQLSMRKAYLELALAKTLKEMKSF
jgi:hypothetical protein